MKIFFSKFSFRVLGDERQCRYCNKLFGATPAEHFYYTEYVYLIKFTDQTRWQGIHF